MILAEPAPSQGDLHFHLLGIPVRVHPFFWVISLLIGLQGDPMPAKVVLWVVAMFVSILIHELGHALVQRYFGGQPRIVLHGMGGLAICGDCDRSPRSQILISLAGPAAGFAFAVILLIGVNLAGHQLRCDFWGHFFGSKVGDLEQIDGISILGVTYFWDLFRSPLVNHVLKDFLWINILWGAVNLLPIYPLDGGQVTRELCLVGNPREGMILSLRISMIAAIVMALFGLVAWQSLFVAIMFGYFAFSSYKTMEAYRTSSW